MGMARFGSIAAAGVLVVVLAAGCGATGEVAGGSASSGSTGAGAALPRQLGAADPCALLSAAQLIEVGLAGATALPVTTGPLRSCQWTAPGSAVPTSVMLTEGADLSAFADGLSVVGAVEKTVIGGYPALRSPSEGSEVCSVLVEVGDAAVLSVLSSAGCPSTQRMAELALTNLPS